MNEAALKVLSETKADMRKEAEEKAKAKAEAEKSGGGKAQANVHEEAEAPSLSQLMKDSAKARRDVQKKAMMNR